MKCERCHACTTGYNLHDYCGVCGRNLCDACMIKGCCKNVPALSGMGADVEIVTADAPPPKQTRDWTPEMPPSLRERGVTRESLSGRAEPLLSERIATALSTADVLPVSVSLALPKELQAVALMIACASVLIGYIRAGWNVMSVSKQGGEPFVRFDVPVAGKDVSATSDEVLRALGDLSRA
jgi:hypothetical protein